MEEKHESAQVVEAKPKRKYTKIAVAGGKGSLLNSSEKIKKILEDNPDVEVIDANQIVDKEALRAAVGDGEKLISREDVEPFILRAPQIRELINKPLKRGRYVEVRTEPKIGRNTPCTCGSQKKWKFCCGSVR